MLTDEENSIFFNTDEFAVTALLHGRLITVIEGRTHFMANQVACFKLTLTCEARSVVDALPGDSLVLHEKTYQILEIKPDGTGLATLTLEAMT